MRLRRWSAANTAATLIHVAMSGKDGKRPQRCSGLPKCWTYLTFMWTREAIPSGPSDPPESLTSCTSCPVQPAMPLRWPSVAFVRITSAPRPSYRTPRLPAFPHLAVLPAELPGFFRGLALPATKNEAIASPPGGTR